MKKSELEEAYRELQYRYNKLHSDTRIEIENLKRENKVNLKNQQYDFEDKAYEAWKIMNEKFMKRFITEFLLEKISFEEKYVEYSNYKEIELKLGEKTISSFNVYDN